MAVTDKKIFASSIHPSDLICPMLQDSSTTFKCQSLHKLFPPLPGNLVNSSSTGALSASNPCKDDQEENLLTPKKCMENITNSPCDTPNEITFS